MKKKILSAALYAITTLALGGFFDSLYGAGPVTHHLGLIYIAITGVIMFGIACLLSLLTLRVGVMCGIAASILSWPYLSIELVAIPWGSVFQILPNARWADILAAILMLIISSVYSLAQLRSLFLTKLGTARVFP